MRILIVDDEPMVLTAVRRMLSRKGLRSVTVCDNGRLAIEKLRREHFDIVLLDLIMPDPDGLEVLSATKAQNPRTEYIIITGVDDVGTAVNAVRLGAYDYLVKPVDPQRLFLSIERAYERMGLLSGLAGGGATAGEIPEAFSAIITDSPRMKELLAYADVMARSNMAILITGESGTGKELLARGIHQAATSRKGRFVAVNTTAVPPTLFESQFFGHLKGAFTGAEKDHRGYFRQADGGTLFLDEIGELPHELQVKLLRVLEENSVQPLGTTAPVGIDVRVVSATNRDLNDACRQNRFRSDLMFRLKGAHIHLPPLRERKEDIPLLAAHFLKVAFQRHNKRAMSFSREAIVALVAQDYPGNIRELAQAIESAVLMSDGDTLMPRHLGLAPLVQPVFDRSLCSMKENADTHVAYVLRHTKGDRRQAAQILGVSLRQVHRRIAAMKKDPRWAILIDDIYVT